MALQTAKVTLNKLFLLFVVRKTVHVGGMNFRQLEEKWPPTIYLDHTLTLTTTGDRGLEREKRGILPSKAKCSNCLLRKKSVTLFGMQYRCTKNIFQQQLLIKIITLGVLKMYHSNILNVGSFLFFLLIWTKNAQNFHTLRKIATQQNETWPQCWFNIGPPSTTLAQH